MSDQFEKATQGLMQICQEVNDFTCASVDANVRSVSAAAKGWEESSRNAGQLIQENMARMMNIGRTVTEAKSPRDVMTLHQDFLKDWLDLWMASATRLSEISARTAKDVVQPVAQHANDAFSRIMQKSRVAA